MKNNLLRDLGALGAMPEKDRKIISRKGAKGAKKNSLSFAPLARYQRRTERLSRAKQSGVNE
jgi:hypothetical protein